VQLNILHPTLDHLAEQFYLKDDLLQTKIVILICFFLLLSWPMGII